MIEGVVRRSQFVAPFGPGAMQVLSDGTSVITAGLDHWFSETDATLDIESFRVHEWRLEKDLGVSRLLLPPDFRRRSPYGGNDTNINLTIPVLRFPTWSFCPRCRQLSKQPLHLLGKPRCSGCGESLGTKRSPFLAQVPFVCMCEKGHVQDFPWSEWVHYSIHPTCTRPQLKLTTSGGGTLASQKLKCEGCGSERFLSGITSTRRDQQREQESTVLTLELEKGAEYTCRGGTPWLGIEEAEHPCPAALRATLRGASNIYYALVRSSIFVPSAETGNVDPDLMALLTDPQGPIRSALETLLLLGMEEMPKATQLRKVAKANAKVLTPYSDAQLDEAIAVAQSLGQDGAVAAADEESGAGSLRDEEYAALRGEIDSPDLVVRQAEEPYESALNDSVSSIRLVEKLRETRALWGFNRVFAEADREDREGRAALLRRKQVQDDESWLPAYTVLGEGIFLELNADKLAAWEEGNPAIANRVAPISERFQAIAEKRHLTGREIFPRFILAHTLAHMLINQLTYDCGYSSASLRERLYVDNGRDGTAGMLIYTAAGDSEGTLGGLVRMGKPGRFETVLESAISAARWCSSDPVCIDSSGQGPDSCNLAACHTCGLLPETACEEFNRFLDRGLVVGTLSDPDIGFFSQGS
nr:DUF1998 domain-containing protein [Streptomyces alboflavus]